MRAPAQSVNDLSGTKALRRYMEVTSKEPVKIVGFVSLTTGSSGIDSVHARGVRRGRLRYKERVISKENRAEALAKA